MGQAKSRLKRGRGGGSGGDDGVDELRALGHKYRQCILTAVPELADEEGGLVEASVRDLVVGDLYDPLLDCRGENYSPHFATEPTIEVLERRLADRAVSSATKPNGGVVDLGMTVDGGGLDFGIDDVGGKGLRLAEMNAALRTGTDFAIPPAVCVTTDVYRAAVESLDLGDTAAAVFGGGAETGDNLAATHALFRGYEFDPATVSAVGAFVDRLGPEATLAVRSSATIEDGAKFSLAGLCESRLHVARETGAVLEAVKECWISLWAERVVTYAARMNAGGDADGGSGGEGGDRGKRVVPEMAVVVQEMIDGAVAGVCFTIDPSTAYEDAFLVEAVHGLGEGLVSGEVDPTGYLITFRDGAIVNSNSPPDGQAQKVVRAVDGSGVAMVDTTEAERSTAPLDDRLARVLADMGLAVASFYGHPQDIEWVARDGVVFVTQTRPITKYTVAARMETPWFCGFTHKAWLAMSMTSMSGHHLAAINGLPPLHPWEEEEAATQAFFGEAYVAYQLHSASKVSRKTGFLDKERLEVHADIIVNAVAKWRRIEPRLLGLLPRLDALEPAFLCRLMYGMVEERVAFAFHSFTSGEIAREFVTRVDGMLDQARKRDPGAASGLAAGAFIDHVHFNTGAAMRDLQAVADGLGDDDRAEAARRFAAAGTTPSGVYAALVDGECGGLKASLTAFLQDYFYMCDEDEDIDMVRWIDDPSFPLRIFASMVAADRAEGRPSGGAGEVYGPELRTEHVARIEALNVPDKLKRLVTFGTSTLRRFLHLKEEVHLIYIRLNFVFAVLLRHLAQRWIDAGLGGLARRGDIFFLDSAALVAGIEAWGEGRGDDVTAAVAPVLRHHKGVRMMFRSFDIPRAIYNDLEVDRGRGAGGDGDDAEVVTTIVGLAAAPGRVQARARVIRTLDEADQVQAGELLVTETTSPGWTPLFSIIAGLVTEKGGLLSHGAVVARECSIPAVLRAKGCTKTIKTGDLISLDGGRGVVEIVREDNGDGDGAGDGAEGTSGSAGFRVVEVDVAI